MKFFLKIIIAIFFLFTVVPVYAGNGAKIELKQKNISLNVGDQETVTVRLNPQDENIIGVDLMMHFDPSYIKIINVVNLGAIASQTGKIIDNDNGQIKYAISNSYDVYLTKPADIVNITVEAKKQTNHTYLTFDFELGKTYDTNAVIKGGKDVLVSVDTLDIAINSSSGNSNDNGNNPSPTGSPSTVNPSASPQVLGSGNNNGRPKSTINPLASNKGNPKKDQNSNQGEILGTEDVVSNETSTPGGIFSFLQNKELFWGLLILGGLIVIFVTIQIIRKVMRGRQQK